MWDAVRLACARRVDRIPRAETEARRVWAKLVSVYDGDTVTLLVVHNGRVRRRRCRCVGYDSPELRGATSAEKERAEAAREFLKRLLAGRRWPFRVRTAGMDKYGRLLVDLRVRGEPLSEVMIRNGHGYAYFGGKKRGTP